MLDLKLLRMLGVTLGVALAAAIAIEELEAYTRDLWVHPREDTYDPARHYKDAAGELFYKHEREIVDALGDISVERAGRPLISVEVGPSLLAFAEEHGGSLVPVILFDSDDDEKIDRTVRGRMEGSRAVFDSARLEEFSLRYAEWQLGIRFAAGPDGDAAFDGRYLASVDSEHAQVAYRRLDELAPVGAASAVAGLVILKHREGAPFDFAKFVENPALYSEDFVPLTRGEDGDDWTVDGKEGRLVTHLDREDLLLVRTEGGPSLDVLWADMPLAAYLEDELYVGADTDGCYSSLETELTNEDGSSVAVPHRMLYCPDDSVALFDAPPGYQIDLMAMLAGEVVEATEASTSIRDNARLYMREINPRSPSSRSTGSVLGNVRAGFRDAGSNLGDALRHTFTGTRPTNIHTGQQHYRPSPVVAVPRTLASLATLRPLDALGELADGVNSAVLAGASVVSAVDNAAVNPALQLTVGVASTRAADQSGDVIGAVAQALAKNLPGGERSLNAVNPFAAWNHDRAFAPIDYTRTDTQLNFDRAATTIDVIAIRAVERHNDDSSSGNSKKQNGDQSQSSGATSQGGNGGAASSGARGSPGRPRVRANPGRHHGKGHHARRHVRRHPGRKHPSSKPHHPDVHDGKHNHGVRDHGTHGPAVHQRPRRPHGTALPAKTEIPKRLGAAFTRVKQFCGFAPVH
jgi:hypothetical protein